MPVLWRFLIGQYVKVLLLCIVVFIAILLVTRLDEVAHYAVLQPNVLSVLLFFYYQVAFVIPIAIPVACLIASILLFQQLSSSCELTAMRAGGLSIRRIFTPILITAGFLSLANFYITSEIGPESHLATRQMRRSFLTFNPFVLLKQPQLLRIEGMYANYKNDGSHEKGVSELLIALYNRSHHRIHMLTAHHVYIEDNFFIGEDVNTISSLQSDPPLNFDQLILEHQKIVKAPAESFSYLVRQDGWKLKPDQLNLSVLLSSMGLESNATELSMSYSEIFRRLSIGIAPFSLTFLGIAFGISISRNPRKQGMIFMVFLVLFFLICFAFGKDVSRLLPLSIAAYLIPQLLMIACSIWTLRRISRGVE